ncbi:MULTISPECIES: 2OG-Fe(II) oxygenase [Calothrix]|uniref:2OG-Fe(II) oxygenase n=2 Tax=Calothrix TaxID=1186 RepID=A0ABR8AMM8_9CYAN|nr:MULTISPECIES: 2OG-Fe(II) oxygenase [Calothrix]MBD2199897.1 2OG-Fe(II) oxygenase [Calothrix parietina FACHB-288]MBD2228756.1 2OG-Fe(II) oxygenase [Calothrix anomala FACHB-343]
MSILLQKIQNRLIRNFYNLPFLQYQAELEYQEALAKHIVNLPIISPDEMNLIETINNEGVAITSLEALGFASTTSMFESAKSLMHQIPSPSEDNSNEFVVHANPQQIMAYPEIFLWGLEQRLINLVETYLGLPVAYHGAYLRRDIANQVEQKSRLWHIDKEDRKVLKIIVYLQDMSEDRGPFQYIPLSLTSSLSQSLKYHHGYIQDATMQKIISPTEYKSCLGAAGTVIIAATGSIFHRGKVPVAGDRFALFYDYTSRIQTQSFYGNLSLSHQDLLLLSQHLSQPQRDCIFWQHKL